MASSFKLEFPLNDALPNTEHARDRLLAKVFKYRKARYKPHSSNDEDYSMIYAYGMSLRDFPDSCVFLLILQSFGHGPVVEGDQRGRVGD